MRQSVELWNYEEMKAMLGAVQANCGCLVGNVCMGVRILVFAP